MRLKLFIQTRRFVATIVCAAILPLTAFSQSEIEFSADFPAGSMGEVCQASDSLYVIDRCTDPENPIDSTLKANANWFFYRISGISGRKIKIEMPENRPLSGASFSYDCKIWQQFPQEDVADDFISLCSPTDTVYIATFVPYTYQHHLERISQWEKSSSVKVDTIGFSADGRPLQMLHIRDGSDEEKTRKRVWIHGRIHPSETPGSYLLDGLIDKLLDDSPSSVQLRKDVEFFILPIANPDGVANALSRSNAQGVNLEINYNRPDDSTAVEVQAIKKTLRKLSEERPFDIALNNHSQKANSATFWIHDTESTSEEFFLAELTFANLLCIYSPYMTGQDFSFSKVSPKYVEGWFWDNFRERTLALTLESPYNFYSSCESVTTGNLALFGEQVLRAIAVYLKY